MNRLIEILTLLKCKECFVSPYSFIPPIIKLRHLGLPEKIRSATGIMYCSNTLSYSSILSLFLSTFLSFTNFAVLILRKGMYGIRCDHGSSK
jgi:hypothetical protein